MWRCFLDDGLDELRNTNSLVLSFPLWCFEPTALTNNMLFSVYRWLGLAGQIRPKKLISNLKEDVYKLINGDEFERPSFKDIADHVMDKSLYALALCTQIPISSSTSLFLSSEAHGERKGRRNKVLLFHKASL